MTDFLIIGGGINGLLLSRELLASGASVCLVDKGELGREASWAGGGIVSPLYPWRYREAVTALADWAQVYYPRLAAQLLAETGSDVEFSPCGLLMLDAKDAGQALSWAADKQRSMLPIDEEQIYAREPGLAPGFKQGLWMQEIANVRNPRLLKALQTALQQSARLQIHEQSQVTAMQHSGSRINEIEVRSVDSGASRKISAGEIIVSAGAWTRDLLAFAPEKLAVEPVKGQMLLYQFQQLPIQSIVLHQGRYLIPRRDGHVLVGSTLEHVGFDKSVTSQARESLIESAEAILPQLKEMRPKAQWAGLRPGSPKGVPMIGRLPSFENLSVCSGHFRNGLVLAPASARLLADILLGREPILDAEPYAPGVDQ